MDRTLDAARKELTDRVLGRPGVVGTAVGEEGGEPCLLVYVSDEAARKHVPGKVGRYRVVVERTGPFRAR